MNLLILDDELYVARALKRSIKWESIGIKNVFTSFSVQHAKEVFEREQVDIVLTDIELPQENGLELVRWAKERGYSVKAICLTCHDDFKYAAEAISLGYSEYLVKPIDFKKLTKTIKKLVDEITQEKIRKEEQKRGRLWESNSEIIERNFWERLILGKLVCPKNIIEEAKNNELDYRFDVKYSILLFAIRKIYNKKIDEQDYGFLERTLCNVAQEVQLVEEGSGRIGWYDRRMWVIMEQSELNKDLTKLEEFIHICRSSIGLGVVVYVGTCEFGEYLNDEYKNLIEADLKNVTCMEGIISMDVGNRNIPMHINSDEFIASIDDLLRKGDYRAYIGRIIQYLQNINYIEREQLFSFIQNILQGIYAYLLSIKVPASRLLEMEQNQYIENAYHSVDYTILWLRQLLLDLESLTLEDNQDHPIVKKVKKFIKDNIYSKLDRQTIAEHVYLSPDHVGRLFKKETGYTLVEYIISQKVEKAKELIDENSYTIGEIAQKLGYDNFSYFSEVFKKETGYSPTDYKRRII